MGAKLCGHTGADARERSATCAQKERSMDAIGYAMRVVWRRCWSAKKGRGTGLDENALGVRLRCNPVHSGSAVQAGSEEVRGGICDKRATGRKKNELR